MLDSRKRFVVRIEEVDGKSFEYAEALEPFWRWQYVFRHSVSSYPPEREIQIRLKTKVATPTSKAKDPVEAVVIAPVMVEGQFVIPAGALVRGDVEKATQSTKPDERSTLLLAFTEIEIDGAKAQTRGARRLRGKRA